ncbi:MAG: hypothetical protein COA78_36655 [Blastopirellula sp.]|nr:MAG: hypothetical protein COA78_36655 [Blastopirellula sp.]
MSYEKLIQSLNTTYPEYPFQQFGTSGACLLYEVLRQSTRSRLILPAFICCELSFMGAKAGKQLRHIDVDRATLHMRPTALEAALSEGSDEDTILLIDHSFGYPCVWISSLRDKHPGLLIIEDCVRSLGASIDGQPIGHSGHYVLLSMYKTVPGNNHGAILLSSEAVVGLDGPVAGDSLRQKLSQNPLARWVYEINKRRHPAFGRPNHADSREIQWTHRPGKPSLRGTQRFLDDLSNMGKSREQCRDSFHDIRSRLSEYSELTFIQPAAGAEPSYEFLSMTVAPSVSRDKLLETLHRKGYFLLSTWDRVPVFFTVLQNSFPAGKQESVYLADHIVHIPLRQFFSRRQRHGLGAQFDSALRLASEESSRE